MPAQLSQRKKKQIILRQTEKAGKKIVHAKMRQEGLDLLADF